MWLFSAWKSAEAPPALVSEDLFAMSAEDMEGKKREMSEFKGQVLLVTNIASRCGLAPEHMKQFNELKDKYGKEGFEGERTEGPLITTLEHTPVFFCFFDECVSQVLAFPTLQFKHQEEKDPQAMCQVYKKLQVNFPVFATTCVNGPDTNPIFQYCKFHSKDLYSNGQLQAVGWNYGKFLLDREGRVYGYYGPRTSAASLEGDIEKLLKNEAHGKKRNKDGILE
ncbi:hypothetical protein Emag_000580 [Eimeria magna]